MAAYALFSNHTRVFPCRDSCRRLCTRPEVGLMNVVFSRTHACISCSSFPPRAPARSPPSSWLEDRKSCDTPRRRSENTHTHIYTSLIKLQLTRSPRRPAVSSSTTESYRVYFHRRGQWYLARLRRRSLLIASSYSHPEGASEFLKLISLCASSFHESSAPAPPGHRSYQLMVNPQAEIRPANTHPVLLVQ